MIPTRNGVLFEISTTRAAFHAAFHVRCDGRWVESTKDFYSITLNVFKACLNFSVQFLTFSVPRKRYQQPLEKQERPPPPKPSQETPCTSTLTDVDFSAAPRGPLIKKVKIKCSRIPDSLQDELLALPPTRDHPGNLGKRRSQMLGVVGLGGPRVKKPVNFKSGTSYNILENTVGHAREMNFKRSNRLDGSGGSEVFPLTTLTAELQATVKLLLAEPEYQSR